MEDLQKNKAIYKAMCEISEKYFSQAIEKNEKFREFMAEECIISARELMKEPKWHLAQHDIEFDMESVSVDTFSCKFKGDIVLDMMQYFKSLAKERGDYVFTYEEEIANQYVGSIFVTLENPTGAKTLALHTTDDELLPNLNHVLMEIDTNTSDVNFVAYDGHTLGVVSTNVSNVYTRSDSLGSRLQILFTAKKWKRICDYAKQTKEPVKFEVYRRMCDELQDTAIVRLGNKRIRSAIVECPYPNWRSVLVGVKRNYNFTIHPDDVNAANKFIKNIKCESFENIYISFYRGSDIVYLDYFNYGYGASTKKSFAFRLKEPSRFTIGTCYAIDQLKKFTFTGFHIEDPCMPSIIDCKETDILLACPKVVDGECVFDVENREVLEAEFAEVV